VEGETARTWKTNENFYVVYYYYYYYIIILLVLFPVHIECFVAVFRSSHLFLYIFRVCTSSYVGWSPVLSVIYSLVLSYLNRMKCRSLS